MEQVTKNALDILAVSGLNDIPVARVCAAGTCPHRHCAAGPGTPTHAAAGQLPRDPRLPHCRPSVAHTSRAGISGLDGHAFPPLPGDRAVLPGPAAVAMHDVIAAVLRAVCCAR